MMTVRILYQIVVFLFLLLSHEPFLEFKGRSGEMSLKGLFCWILLDPVLDAEMRR